MTESLERLEFLPGASVVFRVAGDPRVGYGHVRRSWTLAARLRDEGFAIHMVTTSQEAASALTEAGFRVTIETSPNRMEQLLGTLRHLGSPMVCIVDDPTFSEDGLAEANRRAPVLCLDDTCERAVPVDVVVNGSAGAETLSYRGRSTTRYLLGPAYILLRSEFAQEPRRAEASETLQRVLLLTGGSGDGGVLSEIVPVIHEVLPQAYLDVVIGPFGAVPALNPSLTAQVRFHQNPENMRSLMLQADIAISGGGQTVYELAATATPTLGIQLAENQAINLRGLAAAGALRHLGAPDENGLTQRLASTLVELAQDPEARAAMGTNGRRVVDGRGTQRVAAAVRTLALESSTARMERVKAGPVQRG